MKGILILMTVSLFNIGCIQTEKRNSHSGIEENTITANNINHNHKIDYTTTCKAPNCRYFIKENIKWDKEYEKQNINVTEFDNTFPIKVGVDMLDTMLILTENKLILIRGLYSYYNNDTVRMPQSGEFGINFNVMDKGEYQIGLTKKIVFNQSNYVLHDKLEYQWWCLIKDKLEINKDNSIEVSGP